MECLNSLVQLARNQSPFYADQFKSIDRVANLEDLPITNRDKLWAAAKINPDDILTGQHLDGLMIRTGGTTGAGNLTCYSQLDWEKLTQQAGVGLLDSGVQTGDRIANLLAAGDLHGSFLLGAMGITTIPIPVMMVPLGWGLQPSVIRDRIDECRVTVLLGPPTILVTLAQYCIEHGLESSAITTIMYAGERLSDSQLSLIKNAFPEVRKIRPMIYGSVDAGLVATSAATDGSEDHTILKVFEKMVFVEIVTEDDNQIVISENEVPGQVVVTNLTRQLHPVIRYPVGDRAEWVDRKRGLFRILGRTSFEVRIGMVAIDMEHIQRLITQFIPSATAAQAIIRKTRAGIDELEWVVAISALEEEVTSSAIVDLIYGEIPMFVTQIKAGYIAPLKVSLVQMSQIRMGTWSGKMKRVIDLRFDGE